MENPVHQDSKDQAQQDPRVYFAAERTLLAWIRTGLGLMGVGFAVARFGLFLREFRGMQSNVALPSTGLSLWSGVALVTLGVIVNITAATHHAQLVRQLSSGTWSPGASRSGILLAAFLAILGAAMAVYLLFVH